MPAKTLELEGYGKVVLNPVNIKDKDYEVCDNEGNALKLTVEGKRARTVYKTKEGAEIPSTQVCKKFVIEGEEIIANKMNPTNKVEEDDIEQLEENGMIYNSIERKFYNVSTDNKKIKKLLDEGKSLKFPFIAGLGWKAYEAILTKWKDHLVLVGCRGDINEALDVYRDETVELEIDVIPQGKKAKKLLKAITV